MKKIKDERLVLKNLQNIRIAYIVQTMGIIGILVFDLLTKGLEGMREDPLWIVFMITMIISAFLTMNISIDYESNQKSPKKNLGIALVVIGALSTIFGFLVAKSEGFTVVNGAISGGIIFLCGLVPTIYIYHLRKKRQQDE